MWAYERIFYQIYPLGMTGAPFANDGILTHRILKVKEWIPHLQKLGIGAVYFSPLFESDTHGYNTRDYRRIDTRLGTNADFWEVCEALHEANIRIILDGVFNHAGRGFFAFLDVLKNRENSPYRDWFFIDFNGNSRYNDGLWYEGWEGCYDLVKLNLRNEEVVRYLLESVRFWIDQFGIDGLRLDVAYMLDEDFLRRLRRETGQIKEDFFLLGEILGGDYNRIMNDQMCHSATNYECYKGLYSSFNSMNLFEIVHSLQRQFGPESWTLYRGRHPVSFADNHDVTRLASNLTNAQHLPLLYTLLYGMPGIPMLYYGSEWGVRGHKNDGDPALRPAIDEPLENALTDHLARLGQIWTGSKALQYGEYRTEVLTNRQCVFRRFTEQENVYIVINADEQPYTARFDTGTKNFTDLITGNPVSAADGMQLAPYQSMILQPA